VLFLVVIVISFGCFEPVKRLAGKIVSEVTYARFFNARLTLEVNWRLFQ